MKNITRIFNGNYSLDNVPTKLILKKNMLYLPAKCKGEYIDEGLCFGYPGENGFFTTVEYTPVFGILADDIKAYVEEIEEIKEILKSEFRNELIERIKTLNREITANIEILKGTRQ